MEKKTTTLVKGSGSYKLIVPRNVEEKIRYLLRKFPSTEWSGILFYKHTGSFESNDLVITCEDIYPMDLGSSTFTDFKMSSEVAGYMGDNIDLFDCCMGLVHSHHSMGAFFSGTDLATLKSEGLDTNCFVSLIVDTRGTYAAAVTRKIQKKSEVTVKYLGQSYEFFGDGEIPISNDGTETTQVVDETVIEYFELDVERHAVTNPLDYLDRRFEEIEKHKKEAEEAKKKARTPAYSDYTPYYISSTADRAKTKGYKEQTFWDDKWWDEFKPKAGSDFDLDTPAADTLKKSSVYTPDSALIHKAVCHMITCSLVLNVEKFDLKQWIKKHMVKMYAKMFPDRDDLVCQPFDMWKDFIVEYTLSTFTDPAAPPIGDDEYTTAVAEAMIEELTPYVADNIYVSGYIEMLEQYII